jgi:hypothetical protein
MSRRSKAMSRRAASERLGGKTVYSGIVFDIVHVYDASSQEELEFALADDSVRAYPVDRLGNLWLASEQREGLGSERVIRAASGSVEDGEDSVTAALREANEELGVGGGSAKIFHESTTSLKLLNTITHILIQDWIPGPQHLEPSEQIVPYIVSLADIPELIWKGRILEDPVALALLKLHHMMLDGKLNLDESVKHRRQSSY